jgi:hypothetical protein
MKREAGANRARKRWWPRCLCSLSPFRQKQKGYGTPERRRVVASAPVTVRRRPLNGRGQLAFRRSTTALPRGCVVPWCDPGQASWANRPRGGGHSADGVPTSSDAPRTPVVMPAGMMPGPPGSGLQARPRAPPLAPPPQFASAAASFSGRDDSGTNVAERETIVKGVSLNAYRFMLHRVARITRGSLSPLPSLRGATATKQSRAASQDWIASLRSQ